MGNPKFCVLDLNIILLLTLALTACGGAKNKHSDDAPNQGASPSIESLDALQQHVATQRDAISALMDQADTLHSGALAIGGTDLAQADCDSLRAAVKAHYQGYDPLSQSLRGGSIEAGLCSNQEPKLFEGAFETETGIPATRLIQERSFGFGTRTTIETLLTADYEIAQQYVETHYSSDALASFSIAALSAQRDFLRKDVTLMLISSAGTVKGPETRLFVSSKDGAITLAVHSVHRNNDDDSKSVTQENETVSVGSDWQVRALPLTYGWSGGLFQYADGWDTHPNEFVTLHSLRQGGKDVCADGMVGRHGSRSKFFPEDEQNRCSNFSY